MILGIGKRIYRTGHHITIRVRRRSLTGHRFATRKARHARRARACRMVVGTRLTVPLQGGVVGFLKGLVEDLFRDDSQWLHAHPLAYFAVAVPEEYCRCGMGAQ